MLICRVLSRAIITSHIFVDEYLPGSLELVMLLTYLLTGPVKRLTRPEHSLTRI